MYYVFRYTSAMTKYEDIFDIAADNHGLITSRPGSRSGHHQQRARAICQARRVTKVGHGLYQLTQWIPEQNDAYAWAVMSVGPDAVLYGESVIAMLGLAPTNPTRTFDCNSPPLPPRATRESQGGMGGRD